MLPWRRKFRQYGKIQTFQVQNFLKCQKYIPKFCIPNLIIFVINIKIWSKFPKKLKIFKSFYTIFLFENFEKKNLGKNEIKTQLT